jgi:uncharacterized membrane protein
MQRIGRLSFAGDDDQDGANRQTASLAGMAIALLLVVAGLFLIHQLHAKAMVEDCLMANRINCDKVVSAIR